MQKIFRTIGFIEKNNRNKIKKLLFLCFIFITLAGFTNSDFRAYFNSDAIIVYGSQNSETKKLESQTAFEFKKRLKTSSLLRADTEINQSNLRNSNLIILGTNKSNNILNFSRLSFVKSNFPVKFNEDYFEFGQRFYSEPNDAILFRYPSPYNPKNLILVFYSNSAEGLQNLLNNAELNSTVDYQIINRQGKIIRKGLFNKANFSWRFDSNLDKDSEKVQLSSKKQKSLDSVNFRFYFYPDSFAANRINTIAKEYESYYKKLSQATNSRLFDKVSIYLYDQRIEGFFPDKSFYSVKSLSREIHAVYNDNSNYGLPGFARFYFNDVLKYSDDKLIADSFVIYAVDLQNNNLDHEISKFYKDNNIPALLDLIKKDKTNNKSYLILGSFTKYLINRYGFANYKEIIVRSQKLEKANILGNITPGLYTSFSRLEREWLYYLQDLKS